MGVEVSLGCVSASVSVSLEVLTAGMQQWRDALRISFNCTVGVKVFIEQEVPALTRVVNGQDEHGSCLQP